VRIIIDLFQIIFMNLYARDWSLTNLEKQEEEGRQDVTLYMFRGELVLCPSAYLYIQTLAAMLEWIFSHLQATM